MLIFKEKPFHRYTNIFPMMLGMDPVCAYVLPIGIWDFNPHITSHTNYTTRFHKMMTSIVEQYEGTVGNLAQKIFKSGWLSKQSLHCVESCWKLD